VLFLFKSVGTFLDAIAFMHGPRLAPPNWGLPLGVSFFTFTQIIYLLDAFPRPPTSPAALRIFQGLRRPNSLFEHATYRVVREGQEDPVVAQGAADVERFFAITRVYPDGTPRTKHVTTNVMVEVDGDTATARSYYTVMQQTEVLALQPIICGRYHDAFAKQGGAWRFTDRLIFSDLIGDLSQHLTVDFFGAEETEGMST